jgi:hypothetical protein
MRHAPRNLRLACYHKGLTHFGGIYFFREFLRVLQLRNFLSQHLTYPRRNHRYSLSQMILAFVYPMLDRCRLPGAEDDRQEAHLVRAVPECRVKGAGIVGI